MSAKLALALDVESTEKAEKILKEIEGLKIIIKIGYRLFIKEGTEITEKVKSMGFELFLDLKLHDIPNTVYNGVKSAVDIGADYLTVHTLGGKEMLEKAVEASEGTGTKLLGVTILTSHGTDYTDLIGSRYNLDELAEKLAKTAVETGVHGIVSSPFEVSRIKKSVNKSFISVTPGIRLPEDSAGDQKRVATPEFAVKEGADIIVVGRPVLEAKNKKEKIKEFLRRIQNA
ncbi:orotidine-5'-phosphate decarboxylase [Persephonella sp.]